MNPSGLPHPEGGDPLDVRGRVAIVTGAASGYGRATAELFASHGMHVVACDINEAELHRAAATFSKSEKHLIELADVSQVSECERLVTQALKHFGRLDALVNIAAVLQAVEIQDVNEAHWTKTLDVNLKGPYFLSRAAAVPMRRARWGRIVNFVSTAGITGGSLPVSVYGLSKAGLIAMTKSFARSLARDNVLVNAISPATQDTPLFRRGLPEPEVNEILARYLDSCPFGRWTQPVEVARATLFLVSNLATCVTGHLLRADSGAELSSV